MESKPVSYVLIVLEAEEFVDMINKQVLDSHIKSLQKIYPGYTLCYLINKLMRYLHKRFENTSHDMFYTHKLD
jgi:crossover junction endonuclease EME1